MKTPKKQVNLLFRVPRRIRLHASTLAHHTHESYHSVKHHVKKIWKREK